MNTTTAQAAETAGVTTATIRTWCRMGAIRATKHAGRWSIEFASLAYRIDLGKQSISMDYQVTQTDTGAWQVSRTNGTADYWHDTVHIDRAHADLVAEVASQLPAHYHIKKVRHTGGRNGFGKRGTFWHIYGGASEDPQTLSEERPESTPAEVLVRTVRKHADGAAERIAKQNTSAPAPKVPAKGWSKAFRRRQGGIVHDWMEDMTGAASPARAGECHYCGLNAATCDCR